MTHLVAYFAGWMRTLFKHGLLRGQLVFVLHGLHPIKWSKISATRHILWIECCLQNLIYQSYLLII